MTMRLPLPGGRLHPRSPRPSPQQARDPHSSAYSPFGIEIKLKQNRPWRVALSAPVRLRGRSRSERKKAFLRKSFAFGASGFPPSALEGPPRCHGCWGAVQQQLCWGQQPEDAADSGCAGHGRTVGAGPRLQGDDEMQANRFSVRNRLFFAKALFKRTQR